jgi:hypothetical protein
MARTETSVKFESTCFHEAAHAVVGTLLGRTIESIAVGAKKKDVGPPTAAGSPDEHATCLVAGGIAELLLLGRDGGLAAGYLAALDLVGADVQRLGKARRDALALVQQHKDTIARVAAELRKKKRLTGPQVKALLEN